MSTGINIGKKITVQDEGLTITSDVNQLNFTGTGVTASASGNNVTVNVTGGGGSSFTYEIGQYVASEGGVIAHRWWSTSAFGPPTAGTVQNYLVLDTVNVTSGGGYYANVNVFIANTNSLYDGFTNTTNLISAGSGSGITSISAAGLCDANTNNGKTDWYLGSVDEMMRVFNNRLEIEQGLSVAGGTPLTIDYYWSSTQATDSSAYRINFITSTLQQGLKSVSNFVRAMRRFSI